MAYARYESVAVNTSGDVIPNATIEVREDRAGRPVVPLWANREGTEPLGNPIKSDELGKFGFYAKGGSYYVRVFTGPSQQPFQQYVRRHQAIGTAAERDVEDLATALETGTASFATLAEMEAFTPSGGGVGGKVYADPVAASNGYYSWDGAAWVWKRPLTDTLARLNVTGGTANAIVASLDPGVDGAHVAMLFIEPTGNNTAPVFINGKEVKTVDEASLLAGQWLAGRTYWFTDEGSFYKLRNESDVSGLVAQAEQAAQDALQAKSDTDDLRGETEVLRDEAAGFAAGLNLPGIVPGDAGKQLVVAEDEDGYELRDALVGGIPSRAWAIDNLHPFIAPESLRTDGYTLAGDLGGALYRLVVAEPAHAGKFSITLADGVTVAWYEISGAVVNTKMFGAKADGSTDDVAAIHAAVAYSKTIPNPHMVISDGIHQAATAVVIDLPDYSTVTFEGSVRSTLASGVAVTIGKSTPTFGLTVHNADAHRPLPVTSACGIELLNLVFSKGSIRRTYGFTWGVRCNGTHANGGFSYNQFTMGYHHDSVINLILTASGSGYCNENTLHGGSYNHTSAWGATEGSINIVVDHFAASPLNNNRFMSPSLEDGNLSGYAKAMEIHGWNTLVFHPRMENPADLDGYFIDLTANSAACQIIGLGNGLGRSNVFDQGVANSIQTGGGDVIKRNTPAGDAVQTLQSYLSSDAHVHRGLNSSGTETSSIDGNGNATFAGTADMGALSFAGSATGAAPSAGAGSALPATPSGYVTVTINGEARKVAYY